MEFEIDKIEKLAKRNNLPKKQFKDLRLIFQIKYNNFT